MNTRKYEFPNSYQCQNLLDYNLSEPNITKFSVTNGPTHNGSTNLNVITFLWNHNHRIHTHALPTGRRLSLPHSQDVQDMLGKVDNRHFAAINFLANKQDTAYQVTR